MESFSAVDPAKLTDPSTTALEVLARLVRALVGATANRESGAVTLTQYRLLKRLAARCYLVGELANELEVTPATISVAIDGLVRRGLVERLTRAGDRRTVPLQLTSTGRAVLDAARTGQRATLERILARMDESEQRSLAVGLVALDRALDAARESEDIRPEGLDAEADS